MGKKLLGLFAVFISLTANVVSAFSILGDPGRSTEIDYLREKLFKKYSFSQAVLLMPRSYQEKLKFNWLIAHGSHVSHSSHSSHASHSSHTSGTSSPSYTPNYYNSSSPFSAASSDNPIKAHVIPSAIDPKLLNNPETRSVEVISLVPEQKLFVIGADGIWVHVKVEEDNQTYFGWILETEIIRE